MNNHLAPAAPLEPDSPQPLRRPGPLTHFPNPIPQIKTNVAVASVSQATLIVNENWN